MKRSDSVPDGAIAAHRVDQHWWKAPLIASVIAAPVLGVWSGMAQADRTLNLQTVALAVADAALIVLWVLPHRRRWRAFRLLLSALLGGFALVSAAVAGWVLLHWQDY
ncbi:hypothetical protein FNH09_11135 [Streptomyces adustus]|uniref:Uncharacterized protein n=1 Tax=Streptomyces adustus TaxID=1609272 RepID=A0A5N8VAZ6_9ACTN|nr:hypothetical protein [Streptomyces adustus]MPY31822.1 hypothetical protein [Streptomyces adustus]